MCGISTGNRWGHYRGRLLHDRGPALFPTSYFALARPREDAGGRRERRLANTKDPFATRRGKKKDRRRRRFPSPQSVVAAGDDERAVPVEVDLRGETQG